MSEITVDEIEKVLDEQIRPELSLHGGDIKIAGFENNVLSLRMLGQCSGCPSVNITMEGLVNTKLTEKLPGLKKVSLVNGVSDSLLMEARSILQRRHI